MIIDISNNLKNINSYNLTRKYVRNKLFGYIYYENNCMSFRLCDISTINYLKYLV